MLTVRIVSSDGFEMVKEVRSAAYFPDGPAVGGPGFPKVALFVGSSPSHPNDACEEITNGDVYVMNESGKTVADYHLGRAPQVTSN